MRLSIDLACSVVASSHRRARPRRLELPMFAGGGALDVSEPNQTVLAAAMGRPTRNELLAEYYLRAAGVAAVWIDATGHVGAQDVASIENEPDRVVYCCERGAHFILAYRLYEWKKAVEADQAAIAAKLEDLADRGGVGLTPHAVAVDRAMAAVAKVS